MNLQPYIFFYLSLFIFKIVAIDPNCDYFQDMVLGQEYFIFNREYPGSYYPSTSCRWSAKSSPGTVIVLSCNDVNIPCKTDRLGISLIGDDSFNVAHWYCGQLTFSLISQGNFLSVGLFAGSNSAGGRFECSVAAMRVACSRPEETKIVGGKETKINEFPCMATLISATLGDNFCGASIISDRYALTAAHCLLHRPVSDLGILVGDHDLNTGNDTATARIYRIERYSQHPMYSSGDESNDIAVLMTASQMEFNMGVSPVNLPFRYGTTNFLHRVVTVLGWGFTDISGNKAHTLQAANLTVVSNNYCAASLQKTLNPTQICTYTPGKDSCLSDSGGPLLWKNYAGRFQLVGLISYGISCATDKPAVNTRVTSYLSWIASETSDATYCVR